MESVDASLGDTTDEQVLADAVEEITRTLEAGEPVDLDLYARKYPGHAEKLANLVEVLTVFVKVGRSPARESTNAGRVEEPDPLAVLGDFRIAREIARGGMGIVYEAEQLSIQRRVALKVLPFAAVLDRRQLQRFKNEAQAAGQLHHTNIVPVFSVGCERGIHYYAMQFIEGQSLVGVIEDLRHLSGDAFPAGRRTRSRPPSAAPGDGGSRARGPSSVSSLLSGDPSRVSTSTREFFHAAAHLGFQAAEALEHAHELGVVHRDIKPSNLLIDERGNLWVTDFGLAKFEANPTLTMSGDLLGTLRYMSPEQALARRGAVDHTTDVYSLGVTLYELLTLRPAFVGRDREALLRRITSEEPRSPRSLNRSIPTELETIVLKCMEKERDSRYATARELADDLRRFIEDRPIHARRPSVIERAVKWARRHQTVVGAGVTVLLVIAAALATSTVLIWREQQRTTAALNDARESYEQAERQRAEAETQRELAQRDFEKAREVVDRMLTRVAETDMVHSPPLQKVRHELLEEALRFYEDSLRARAGDPAVRLETGRAYFRAGKVRDLFGEFGAAESAYRSGIAVLSELARESPEDAEPRRRLAEGHVYLAYLFRQTGRLEAARRTYEDADGILEALAREFPGDVDVLLDRASMSTQLAGLMKQAGDYERAQELYERTKAILDGETVSRAQREDFASRTAAAVAGLADIYRDLGDHERAEKGYREAIQLYVSLGGDAPEKPRPRRNMAINTEKLANLLERTGRRAESEELLRDAARIREELARAFPLVPGERNAVAQSYLNLAWVIRGTGRGSEADRLYRSAVDLLRRLVEDFPEELSYSRNLASALNGLGAWIGQRDPEAAERAHREAIAIAEDVCNRAGQPPRDRSDVATFRIGLGTVLFQSDRHDEADASWSWALEMFTRLAREFPEVLEYRSAVGQIRNNLGMVLTASGQFEEAEEHLRLAIRVQSRLVSESPAYAEYKEALARHWANLGDALWKQGKSDEGLDATRSAIELAKELVELFPGRSTCRTNLGHYYRNLRERLRDSGREEEAKEAMDGVIAVTRDLVETFSDNPRYLHDLAALFLKRARAQDCAGEVEAAETNFRRAVEHDRRLTKYFPGVLHYRMDLSDGLRDLGLHLAANGRCDEGLQAVDEAFAIAEKASEDEPEDVALKKHLGFIHDGRGRVFATCGRSSEAEAALRDAIALREAIYEESPHGEGNRSVFAAMQRDLGELLFSVGRYSEAEATCRSAVNLLEAEYEERVASRRGESETDDHRRPLVRSRGGVYRFCGDHDDAVWLADGWSVLATILRKNGNHEEARELLEKATKLQPRSARTQRALARFLATCPDQRYRDAAKAVSVAAKAVRTEPVDARNLSALGIACYRAGKWRLAVRALEKALKLSPEGDAETGLVLAMAHWRRGEKREARRVYETAARWVEGNEPEDQPTAAAVRALRAETETILSVNRRNKRTDHIPKA